MRVHLAQIANHPNRFSGCFGPEEKLGSLILTATMQRRRRRQRRRTGLPAARVSRSVSGSPRVLPGRAPSEHESKTNVRRWRWRRRRRQEGTAVTFHTGCHCPPNMVAREAAAPTPWALLSRRASWLPAAKRLGPVSRSSRGSSCFQSPDARAGFSFTAPSLAGGPRGALLSPPLTRLLPRPRSASKGKENSAHTKDAPLPSRCLSGSRLFRLKTFIDLSCWPSTSSEREILFFIELPG